MMAAGAKTWRMKPGHHIEQARKKLGLSPAKVAKEIGVSRTAVENWEKSVNVPRGANAQKLLKALKDGGLTKAQLNPYGSGGVSFVSPVNDRLDLIFLEWSDLRRLVGGRVAMQGLKRPTYIEADKDNASLHKDCVALRVNDDSMEPKFRQGEIFIVDPNLYPQDNDYVVARLTDGGHVLRRFIARPSGGYDLQAGKARYQTLSIDHSNAMAEIVGVVVEHRERTLKR